MSPPVAPLLPPAAPAEFRPQLSLDFITAATGGTLAQRHATEFSSVDIDGRAVPRGGLWFAIRGERFDGHDFISQALGSGAGGVVLQRGRAGAISPRAGVSVIEVDDTLVAIADLARAHRLRFSSLKVVGVAGSNGKTTTKEMVAAILGAEVGVAAVHKTAGNFNNHIGLPLTLLRLHAGHRYAVLEMGISGLGELTHLADLGRPDVAVIVSIGPEHLETLLTVENVARAEGEIFRALSSTGALVYPAEEPRLGPSIEMSRAVCRVGFGSAPGVAVRVVHAKAGLFGTDVRLRLPDGQGIETRLRTVGLHHAHNAAAAAAVASILGISADAIARGLSLAEPAKHRSTVLEVGGRALIDDCYNASPPSVRAALDTVVALARDAGAGGTGEARGRAIAVLGDMLELGADEELLHRNIGAYAASLGLEALITVGERGAKIHAGARDAGMSQANAIHAADVDAASRLAAATSRPGDVVLVKASRGARFERVVEGLQSLLSPAAAPAAPVASDEKKGQAGIGSGSRNHAGQGG